MRSIACRTLWEWTADGNGKIKMAESRRSELAVAFALQHFFRTRKEQHQRRSQRYGSTKKRTQTLDRISNCQPHTLTRCTRLEHTRNRAPRSATNLTLIRKRRSPGRLTERMSSSGKNPFYILYSEPEELTLSASGTCVLRKTKYGPVVSET